MIVIDYSVIRLLLMESHWQVKSNFIDECYARQQCKKSLSESLILN